MESRILNFIMDNPDTWEQKLADKLIRVNHKGDLACFKYATEAVFSDPLVCEARGIIIDTKDMRVVCWPFDKFFNVQETCAAKIDWESARVLEKVDGSLIKLYWYKDEWQFATTSTCDANDANISGHTGVSFMDVIKKASNYDSIPLDELDKDYTYMFEVVSPMTQIVISYRDTKLYYLAARSNVTGEEIVADMGDFPVPRSYSLRTLNDCMDAVLHLNVDCVDDPQNEGFVVVDKYFNRIKIKSPEYVAVHKVRTNKVLTAKRITELFYQGIDLHELSERMPRESRILKYYDWQVAEVLHSIEDMMNYARALYEEYDHDRKAVANAIGNSPYGWAGFKAIGNEKTVEDMVKIMTPARMEKYIKEYDWAG